ncbi:hypothetical protein OA7_0008765 [Vibrio cyclitrophicus 1F53]|uniref:hypothetical protein n=1 Tax=Vibrio cyclitrophicus TaxID=47951 RepID=UPI0002E0F07D|nr:hypothetical protein [Vibrio cyclitrophicus]OEF34397.1 hypothetical protein OA7_08505 [Vibrio cyclitrophicus 1F53]OEF67068.1 hypothetical protein OAA_06505 [Vibrio cyclitrophicus 1F175]PMH33291.1 hypothetical protein BCU72_01655 [Vibrio cyclitrophicus]PMH79853.1 hypothetical protein BCU60_18845 [Vibrio cyclitrophicus]
MPDSNNYEEIKQKKIESQNRFYKDLYESRDNGSYSIDKQSLKSELIDPAKLPAYSPKNIPNFD